jgi:hypothetical protein
VADRAEWREHEERAGDLVIEADLFTSDWVRRQEVLREWRSRLAGESPERLGSALLLVARLSSERTDHAGWMLQEAVTKLLTKPFEVSDESALLAARTATEALSGQDASVALRVAEAMLGKRFGPSIVDEPARAVTAELVASLDKLQLNADGKRILTRLHGLLRSQGALDTSMITQGDGWAADVVPRLADQDAEVASAVLRHLASATGSKPGKKWAATTGRLLEDPAARAVVRLLVERVVEAVSVPVRYSYLDHPVDVVVDDTNGDVVRAAIWAAGFAGEAWVVPALRAVAERAFAHNGWYIGSQKVPNAAILGLGRIGGPDAVSALSKLDLSVSDNGFRTRIANALAEAGEAQGLSPGAVAERMVDAGGLGADGTVELTDGSVTALATLGPDLTITVTGSGRTEPVIRKQLTELRGLVARERRRVEGLFAEDRDWGLADWRRYYLDHPITGRIAARLLWRFGDEVRLGSDDLPADGRVRLWNPATARGAEVAHWRDWLLEHELRQPFKQAFREVYLLTDAERETRLYSNRFAAHVLRYHQAYALFKERGWKANYLGPYDGGYEGKARREFRDAGLTAVFEHFPVEENHDGPPELCTTDRVWFHRTTGGRDPIPVADVPPLVFSEAMRDVDLFVGVASIALDPHWYDRGDDPHYEYWQRVTFGELSAAAEVRRDVLARILPKLAVADRVELADRFVRVRGNLASYRIHLGSANIMIEPDNRYLCIVPNRGKGSKVLLPFDGDEVLSVILSKIVLLAADDKIKDPTILSQLPSR